MRAEAIQADRRTHRHSAAAALLVAVIAAAFFPIRAARVIQQRFCMPA